MLHDPRSIILRKVLQYLECCSTLFAKSCNITHIFLTKEGLMATFVGCWCQLNDCQTAAILTQVAAKLSKLKIFDDFSQDVYNW